MRRLTSLLQQESRVDRGRKGSVVAERYASGVWTHPPDEPVPDRYPTNEDVTKAVHQKVAGAVEMSRKYKHLAWYAIFVALYMLVLWLQASAYKSGEVVQTLKAAFNPNGLEGGGETVTFRNEVEVLEYIGQKVLLPIWKDPDCGDGKCEWPWEFPSWGRFGCRADCGRNPNTTKVVVNVRADFTGHPSISPRTLMRSARWNLCLEDAERRLRGEADLCWYEEDQAFDQAVSNVLKAHQLIDGNWYVVIKGDYAGRVGGRIFDLTDGTSPTEVATEPVWKTCKLRRRSGALTAGSLALRRLLEAYTQAQRVGGDEARRLMREASEHVQSLPEVRKLREARAARAAAAAAPAGNATAQEGSAAVPAAAAAAASGMPSPSLSS